MKKEWVYEEVKIYDGYGRLVETRENMTAAEAADYAEGEGWDHLVCVRYTPKARWIRCAYFIWSDSECGLVRTGSDGYSSHLAFVRARCERDGIPPLWPHEAWCESTQSYFPKWGHNPERAKEKFRFFYGSRV